MSAAVFTPPRELLELRQFADAAPVILWATNAEGACTFLSRGWYDATGQSEAEALGAGWFNAVHPEDRDQARQLFMQANEARTPFTLDYRLRQKNGEYRWASDAGNPRFSGNGEFLGFAGCVTDIHERRLARLELQSSEERYRRVVENQSEMVCRFRPDGTILFVNSAYARSRGRTAAEMTSQNFWQFIPREDHDGLRAMLDALTPETPEARSENRFETTEGTRWTLWTNRALAFDAAGRATEVQSTGVDITERRRAEEALRTEKEKFRLLADTIPQLAWMAHPDGNVFWYNQRWYEYTGTTAQEMEGWGWQSVHSPDALPEVLERWKLSLASGRPFDMVFPLRGADGEFRPFLTRVNPLRDAEGRVLLWFGTNTDVSEIKRMERALLEADRRKDEFLAILSHELRNPLAPIRNFVSLLRGNGGAPELLNEALPVLDRQVGHLVRLVDDLLDVARINRGDIVLQRRHVTLAEVVSAAVETSRPLIQSRGHLLHIDAPQEAITVFGDPVRLSQVLANVLNNAAAYTPAGGRIEVSAGLEEGRGVLRVRDNGAGFTPEAAAHMFELFARGEHTRSHSVGFGIGLALARRLVEMHGGAISASSPGVGLGSEFVITLPVEQSAHTQNSGSSPGASSASGKRILVVDDNVDAAESLALLLSTLGADTQVAYDGLQALAALESFAPEVVLLDIGMPGMNGHEVARAIRERWPKSGVKLVALTGWGQDEDRRRAAEAGFDHHLVKPAEIDELEAILAMG